MKFKVQNSKLKGAGLRTPHSEFRTSSAFTLIEILVVISIIGILAGLLIGVYPHIQEKKIRSRVQTELAAVETIIESYKEKKGFYPPDNTNGPPALYYELTGSAVTDGFTGPPAQATALAASMGIMNIVNVGAEDSQNFYKNVRQSQVAEIDSSRKLIPPPATGVGIKFLVINTKAADGSSLALLQYNSHSDDRHNHESFDLWVDVMIGSHTNRIGNWKD